MQAVDQERAELAAALSQLDAATGVSATSLPSAGDKAAAAAHTIKSSVNFETPIYE
jgi:phage-related minor tail protein